MAWEADVSKDLTRIALATLSVVVVLDILTHGNAAVAIATAVGKAWVAILAVLSGQNRPSGY